MTPLFFKKMEVPFLIQKLKTPFFEKERWKHMITGNIFCFIYMASCRLLRCTTVHAATSVLELFEKHILPSVSNGKFFVTIGSHLFSKIGASMYSIKN